MESKTRHNIHDFHPKCLKGGVAATVIFQSASTTAALHWSFVSPYIHKLIKWEPGSETFDVEMVGNVYSKDRFKFSDVRPPETNRPFVTSFKADGNFYSG